MMRITSSTPPPIYTRTPFASCFWSRTVLPDTPASYTRRSRGSLRRALSHHCVHGSALGFGLSLLLLRRVEGDAIEPDQVRGCA